MSEYWAGPWQRLITVWNVDRTLEANKEDPGYSIMEYREIYNGRQFRLVPTASVTLDREERR